MGLLSDTTITASLKCCSLCKRNNLTARPWREKHDHLPGVMSDIPKRMQRRNNRNSLRTHIGSLTGARFSWIFDRLQSVWRHRGGVNACLHTVPAGRARCHSWHAYQLTQNARNTVTTDEKTNSGQNSKPVTVNLWPTGWATKEIPHPFPLTVLK